MSQTARREWSRSISSWLFLCPRRMPGSRMLSCQVRQWERCLGFLWNAVTIGGRRSSQRDSSDAPLSFPPVNHNSGNSRLQDAVHGSTIQREDGFVAGKWCHLVHKIPRGVYYINALYSPRAAEACMGLSVCCCNCRCNYYNFDHRQRCKRCTQHRHQKPYVSVNAVHMGMHYDSAV